MAATAVICCTDRSVSDSDVFDFADDPDSTSVMIDSLYDAGGQRIERLVIHCTASRGNLDSASLMSIFKERWGQNARPGYHLGVFTDGSIVVLQDINSDPVISFEEIVWGAKGYNQSSIHVFYDGGIDKQLNPKDTRTQPQKVALDIIVDKFTCAYPWIEVIGHRVLNPGKACPSFDVFKEYQCTLMGVDSLYDMSIDSVQ